MSTLFARTGPHFGQTRRSAPTLGSSVVCIVYFLTGPNLFSLMATKLLNVSDGHHQIRPRPTQSAGRARPTNPRPGSEGRRGLTGPSGCFGKLILAHDPGEETSCRFAARTYNLRATRTCSAPGVICRMSSAHESAPWQPAIAFLYHERICR